MLSTSPHFRGWHPVALLAVLALWQATVGNSPLWLSLVEALPVQDARSGLILGAWLLALTSFIWCFLLVSIWPSWLKVDGILWLMVSTSASYFMMRYHVVIDPIMLDNAIHTDAREVRDLLSPQMLVYLLAGVVIPGWWWWRQPVKPIRARRLALQQGGWALMAVLLTGVMLWLTFQDLASTMRNHKPLRYMINPFNTVYAVMKNSMAEAAWSTQPLQTVGLEARLVDPPWDPLAPPLVVLIVGETARAANFGLSGYARSTTPRLSALRNQGDLIYFDQVQSCGTSTQVSLPCMFSDLGRQAFDRTTRRENLLDVLQHAGLATLWIDNQSGCKGVCDRIPHASTTSSHVPGLCEGDECFDEVMLKELPDQLAQLPATRQVQGTLVVLHQMGSHGPAYFKRTPANFKPFQPECQASNLQECSPAELQNTYDNTIRYTDHVVAETVQWLNGQSRPVALVYLSDHGESLGEKGLYLHGMPYSMAPDEQTHVPMLMWMNDRMRSAIGLDRPCLEARAREPASHDHLFHTLLGLTQVRTQAYEARLDLTAACRR